jgi:PKD domain
MKKTFILLILLATASLARAQKEDANWQFGANTGKTTQISFLDSVSLTLLEGKIPYWRCSAFLSDSMDDLQFSSNGCFIADRNGDMVANGDSLNLGLLYDLNCDDDGYPSSSSLFFLRHPVQSNLVYLFHIASFFQITPVATGHKERLYYTVIDAAANDGLGEVLSKNNLILSDSIQYEGIHAVRHANGRDWWLFMGRMHSNRYWTVLFSDKGLQLQEQSIGTPVLIDGIANFTFSPDGSKLARYNPKDDLRLFDFDRCTGLLSNPVHFQMVNDADNKLSSGTAFSADGHYLYVSDQLRLWQFDMWTPDPTATLTKIADRELDGPCALGYTIAWLELGPDGRIYSVPASGQQCMHRMAHPERGGEACEFVQSYYEFEDSHQNMPHFPNYRLGPVDGSACDTLGIDNVPLCGWRYDRTTGFGVDFTSVSWYAPTAWAWDFGDGQGSSERNPSHLYAAAGPYEVCLSVSNTYGADTKCKTVWVGSSGVEDPQGAPGLQFYPNPSTGVVHWKGADAARVKVYEALGNLALSVDAPGGRADLASLPKGMYFLQLFDAEGRLLGTGKVGLMGD